MKKNRNKNKPDGLWNILRSGKFRAEEPEQVEEPENPNEAAHQRFHIRLIISAKFRFGSVFSGISNPFRILLNQRIPLVRCCHGTSAPKTNGFSILELSLKSVYVSCNLCEDSQSILGIVTMKKCCPKDI